MIYTRRHGEHPLLAGVSFSALLAKKGGSFRYLFPAIPGLQHDTTANERLVRLGEAMIDPANSDPDKNSVLPPILTYLGQFIDHDITAGTDSDPSGGSIFDPEFKPLDRKDAVDATVNMRTARLDLDSLYGDGVVNTPFDRKFAKALRSRRPGKMRIAFPQLVPNSTSPDLVQPPKDGANDLLRLGEIMPSVFTEDELRRGPNVPNDVRSLFFIVDKKNDFETDKINQHRAMIGDARNDENLFVAQVHLAMLRLHNRIVDACDDSKVLAGGSDALFEWARQRVRWIYQWLVINRYLGALCDRPTLDKVIADGAPLYHGFLGKGPAGSDWAPMPFEFSIAGFRFGHSMVRQEYDWNPFFPFPEANFSLLFSFTGSVREPMAKTTASRLPSNWPAEWQRLATFDPAFPNRAARKIDTDLSFELSKLPPGANEPAPNPKPPATPKEVWERRVKSNLAARNLLKGHINNLPHAQALIDAINTSTSYSISPLSKSELVSGKTGQALADTGFTETTPLWFYILKEAEMRCDGNRLGELGTVLAADTLLGLVINDPHSYWHQPGSDNGRWHPADAVRPDGIVVDSLPNLLRAALLL